MFDGMGWAFAEYHGVQFPPDGEANVTNQSQPVGRTDPTDTGLKRRDALRLVDLVAPGGSNFAKLRLREGSA